MAAAAGNSVSFKEFQESESWQDFIRKTYRNEIVEEILQKIRKALLS